MKKRFLAFLLALSIAASLLVIPASAAGSNAAVQAAVALGGMTTESQNGFFAVKIIFPQGK